MGLYGKGVGWCVYFCAVLLVFLFDWLIFSLSCSLRQLRVLIIPQTIFIDIDVFDSSENIILDFFISSDGDNGCWKGASYQIKHCLHDEIAGWWHHTVIIIM